MLIKHHNDEETAHFVKKTTRVSIFNKKKN